MSQLQLSPILLIKVAISALLRANIEGFAASWQFLTKNTVVICRRCSSDFNPEQQLGATKEKGIETIAAVQPEKEPSEGPNFLLGDMADLVECCMRRCTATKVQSQETLYVQTNAFRTTIRRHAHPKKKQTSSYNTGTQKQQERLLFSEQRKDKCLQLRPSISYRRPR